MSGSWLNALQPASWRGVPFSVLSSEVVTGRKTAAHQYPFRDQVWIEDLGKRGREFSFRGFLVGEDCYDQEQAMHAAAETAGAGQLIHPSFGSLTVSLVDFSSGQEAERGRSVTLSFRFAEGVSPVYPGVDVSTGDNVGDTAADADDAAGGDFGDDVLNAINEGSDVVQGVVRTVQGFSSQVQGLIGDASLLTHAVAGLIPPIGSTFGRFTSGALGTVQGGFYTVPAALSAATTAQTAVANAAANVVDLAGDL